MNENTKSFSGVGLQAECIQTDNKNLTKGKKYKVLRNYIGKQLMVTDNLGFEKYYSMTCFTLEANHAVL